MPFCTLIQSLAPRGFYGAGAVLPRFPVKSPSPGIPGK